MDQSLVLKKEISPLLSKGAKLQVKTAEDMTVATELLSQMNQVMDKVTEEKEKITKPLNTALKAERERWAPIEKAYKEVIEPLRAKISTYQTEQMRIQKIEAEKIAARLAKGTIKVETAVKKLDAIEKVSEQVETDSGKIKFREDKKLKIINLALLPREYLIPDERKILEDLKLGKTIPGAEIEIVMTPLNYR